MFHPEAENGRAIVIPNFLFLGVESNALTDDGGLGASGTPYGKGHFEADGKDPLSGFSGANAEGMSSRECE